METLLNVFSPYGFNAIIIAVLFWMVNRLQDRINQALENNTKALVELRSIIEQSLRFQMKQ